MSESAPLWLKLIVFAHMAGAILGAGFPHWFVGEKNPFEGPIERRAVAATFGLTWATVLCFFVGGLWVLLS